MDDQLYELLEKCRGRQRKRAFAKRLGISTRTLSALYAGERRPGLRVLRAVAREYPQYSAEIASLFFPLEVHDDALQCIVSQQKDVPQETCTTDNNQSQEGTNG